MSLCATANERAGSTDGRPQPCIAVTGEVANVHRRHDDRIARLANHRRACGQDDIGVERARGGSWHTALPGVCPKQRGLAPMPLSSRADKTALQSRPGHPAGGAIPTHSSGSTPGRVGGWRGIGLMPEFVSPCGKPAASFSIRPPPNRTCSRVGGWRGTACAGVRKPLRETGCVLFPPPPSEPLMSLSISSSSPDRRHPLGSGSCASRTLPLSNVARPVSLRHVTGFPRLGLLRRLRDHGARAR